MSTVTEALEATLEARYRAAVEDNVRLVAANDALRADLATAADVTEQLRAELDAERALADAERETSHAALAAAAESLRALEAERDDFCSKLGDSLLRERDREAERDAAHRSEDALRVMFRSAVGERDALRTQRDAAVEALENTPCRLRGTDSECAMLAEPVCDRCAALLLTRGTP